ncbi:MAG: methyltransferase domain-containing protein [Solirubrobacterales bacterium]|nr:methyltransferase domain-containing protein [Solirubrobacterales bacterium]
MGTSDPSDPETLRAAILERWGRAAPGWGRRAELFREFAMPVSAWLIDHLDLQPGQRVLELAAGPGDTGFMAAELVRPGGVVISSDASEAMLEVARERARALGIENVEFKRLELEWIDMPTASVDAVLCRWGVMLTVDPAAAVQEIRRVLRPGGRLALAVWDLPELNQWATVPDQALVELGLARGPDPDAPGMFSLSAPERLQEMLEAAGFVDVVVEPLDLRHASMTVDEQVDEKLDLSRMCADTYDGLSAEDRDAVRAKIRELAEPFTEADGLITLPARALVAAADA